ncbi:MAG: cell division protein FtsL [Gammaproteobacteria bacterium]
MAQRIKNQGWLTALLVLALLASSVAAIHARHEARRQFIELQALIDTRDELNIDWGRLQIEHSTWASPGRIEQMATDKLNMHVPEPAAVVIIGP